MKTIANCQFCILLISTLFFFSCEYDKDEVYFVDIEKPESSINLDINLAHVNPKDTIIIFQYTKLSYKIDSKGKDILKHTISVDTELEQREDYIVLSPGSYNNSIHKLTIDVELKAHTGSISDLLGYEKYVGKYEYYIKFVKLEESFNVNFRGGHSEEGFLKLNWDKPKLDNADILRYELSFYNDITNTSEEHIFTDPNINSFVDRSYIWWHRTYKLTTWYKNKDVDFESLQISYFVPEYSGFGDPRFSYQMIDLETMRVSWQETGYKCKFLFIDANGTQTKCSENERSIITPRYRFPADSDRFTLYVLPYDLPYEDYKKGIRIESDSWWCNDFMAAPIGWNKNKNEYYTCFPHDGQISVYNISNFSLTKDYLLREVVYSNSIRMSVSNATLRMAIYVYDYPRPVFRSDILIYEDNNFKDPLILERKNIYSNDIFLTDDNRLSFSELVWIDNDYENQIHVYNSLDGSLIFTKALQNRESQITVSSDGKYYCDYYKSHLKIYEMKNSSAELVYEYTNNDYRYTTCQFSNTNPSELILGGEKEVSIMSVPSFTIKSMIKGKFIAQDPITGNFACLDEKYSENYIINILNKDFSKKLCKLLFNHFNGIWHFINNRLIYNEFTTYYIDLSNYIK